MGLLSLDCTEQLNGGLWEEEEDEEGDDEGVEVVVILAIPTSPLTKLKRGSGHRVLLLLCAGSKEKRPV